MFEWEYIAVLSGIVYVLLATKESPWAWPFSFISTFIYTILFWDSALVSSSLLNMYYMVMAVYGFMLWKKDKQGECLSIARWSLKTHLLFIALGVTGTLLLGYMSENYLEAHFAYHDAFVMVFSGIATWMMAQKVLENWFYWMITDTIAGLLYYRSGYAMTVILFLLYVILALYGYLHWRTSYQHRE